MADIEDLGGSGGYPTPTTPLSGPTSRRPSQGRVSRSRLASSCGSCGSLSSGLKAAKRSNPFMSPISTSVFELLKIGIGPSSSHTVGPMIACRNFIKHIVQELLLEQVNRVQIILHGSLALTGVGHYTDKACILGLTGVRPADVDTAQIDSFLAEVKEKEKLTIGFGDGPDEEGTHKEIVFKEHRDILLIAEELPLHPNAMICRAWGSGSVLKELTYYSTGGGFVLTEDEMTASEQGGAASEESSFPIKYRTMDELLEQCKKHDLDIAGVMRRNEEALRSPEEVTFMLEELREAMEDCVNRGLKEDKIGQLLPGPLKLMRRAPEIYKRTHGPKPTQLPFVLLDELRIVDTYAMAVMEENATMGRIVTAPTNGAAGVVPAVLTYYLRHLQDKLPEDRQLPASTYLLTAAAVGILAKENACISGATGGCQAEVGTATAMAAAGLCAVLGGTPDQVEEAAEIALEHSLGMTCDPIMGLVQVPCIERNTMGATKAVNAVSLVLKSGLEKRRSLIRYDDCLRVMKETGKDMSYKYRETAQGGLAADYEEWLQKQPKDLIEDVENSMGLKRITWGKVDVHEIDRVTLEEKLHSMAESRKQSLGLANC